MSTAITYNSDRPYTSDLWRLIQVKVETEPDGIPGQLTAVAVEVWQSENGEIADGKCGPDTLHDMGLGLFVFHDHFDDYGFSWTGHMAICSDGSPYAYRPDNTGIDHYGNAGWPNNGGYGLALDPAGQPYRQGPEEGSPNGWVSTTAMNLSGFDESDQRRYVDATRVPYAVLPRNISDLLPARFRDVLRKGDIVHMTRATGGIVVVRGLYAEVGPSLTLDAETVYGEASVYAAEQLEHNPYKLNEQGLWRAKIGISSGIDYRVYVGTSSRTRIDQGLLNRSPQQLVIEP